MAVAEAGMAQKSDDRNKKVALVIGAGAPQSPLMAGALHALLEKGRTFDVVRTSGAGALVGLLYAAPRGGDPLKALKRVVELGVAEHIYDVFPVGYKAFYKAGPWTQLFRQWAQASHIAEYSAPPPITIPIPGGPPITIPIPSFPYPYPTPLPGGWLFALWWWWASRWLPYLGPPGSGHPQLDADAWRRLYNDWIDLWFSLWTPTTLNYSSLGLCEPLPFLEDMVDFSALGQFRGEFYVNAYNITTKEPKNFYKEQLTPQHVRAALAMPFIYPPVEVNGDLYYEGADRDPLPVKDFETKILDDHDVGKVYILDVLHQLKEHLVRAPQNIWDAYVISIITPIVSLAEKAVKGLDDVLRTNRKEPVVVKFDIPPDVSPHILQWRHSNLTRLWQIGHAAGMKY
jgi:predicted acylesterase/phospholipase RssA